MIHFTLFLHEFELLLVRNYFRKNYFCCWELRNTYCLKTDNQIQALIRHVFHSFQEPLGGVEIWSHINARLIPCPYRQLHMQINSSPFSLRFPLVLMPRKQTHAFPSKCRTFQSPLLRNQTLMYPIPIQVRKAVQTETNKNSFL